MASVVAAPAYLQFGHFLMALASVHMGLGIG